MEDGEVTAPLPVTVARTSRGRGQKKISLSDKGPKKIGVEGNGMFIPAKKKQHHPGRENRNGNVAY